MIRIERKDAVWSIFGTALSMLANFIVLPFILHYLDENSIGLYYVMTNLSSIAILFDFGFSPALSRSMAYAWSGADQLYAQGTAQSKSDKPNYLLMQRIIKSCQIIYGVLSSAALLIAVVGGTAYIRHITQGWQGNNHIIAWLIYAVAIFLNLLYGYYSVFLRGVGAVDKVNKATVISRLLQILLCIVLLYFGAGLIGVAIAYIAYGFSFRLLAKHWFYSYYGIGEEFKSLKNNSGSLRIREILLNILPNTWRDGIVTISNFLLNQATTIIASLYFSLHETGIYSLAIQITTAVSTISMALYYSYQPAIQSAHAIGDKKAKIRYLSAGIMSFVVIFFVGMVGGVLIGEPILRFIKPSYIIDRLLLVVIAVCQFVQNYRNCFCSYLSSTNRLIYYKSFVFSSVLCIVISYLFVAVLPCGVYGLVVAQLASQVIYNIWYWPRLVHKELGMTPKMVVMVGVKELCGMIGRKSRQ